MNNLAAAQRPSLQLVSDNHDWSEVLQDFAEHQAAKGLSATTIRNRHSILRNLERSSGVSHLAVRLPDLRRQIGREGIAVGSRRTERGAMVAFFQFLKEDEYRDDDPSAKLAPVSAPKGTPRPFTKEQIDAMLEGGAYRKTRAMILLGYYQGFRVSSIARVHGGDIDLLSNTIRTVGKGGKDRTLPLHPVIRSLAETMPADDWWFPARGGRPGHMKSASVTNLITIAKKRAGITDPNLTPHSLRHSFGTDLVDSGVDIRVVQELMMHESLATTQIYTGVSARRKQEGIVTLPVREIRAQSGRRTAA
jgi:integrase/recombinase XerD